MLLNNSAQTYVRPVTAVPLRQHLRKKRDFELPGGLQLWKSCAKSGVALLLVVCALQLVLGQFYNTMNETAEFTRIHQLELADQHVILRAKRAALLMPDNIERVAAAELSLQAPEPGQVSRYNKKKGRFDRL
jgi:hypothetical protein